MADQLNCGEGVDGGGNPAGAASCSHEDYSTQTALARRLICSLNYKSYDEVFTLVRDSENRRIELGEGLVLTFNYALNSFVVLTEDGRKLGPFCPLKGKIVNNNRMNISNL